MGPRGTTSSEQRRQQEWDEFGVELTRQHHVSSQDTLGGQRRDAVKTGSPGRVKGLTQASISRETSRRQALLLLLTGEILLSAFPCSGKKMKTERSQGVFLSTSGPRRLPQEGTLSLFLGVFFPYGSGHLTKDLGLRLNIT